MNFDFSTSLEIANYDFAQTFSIDGTHTSKFRMWLILVTQFF